LSVVEKQHEHHVSVSLDPLDDYLVIEPGDAESWTRGGLIIAVGPDAQGIELGDKVLFPVEAGYEVRIGTGTVKVVRREDLIARVID
jgi:co-chaperonin GroES (HSP10)